MISSYPITPQEMKEAEWFHNAEQTVLLLLKKKGAPILGEFWLEVEQGWTISRKENQHNGLIIYNFKHGILR